jgi:hypothetical protein
MTPASAGRTCYLRRLGYTDCDGPLQRHHWITQRRLRNAARDRGWSPAELDGLLGDDDNMDWICHRHHHKITVLAIALELAQIPEKVSRFAAKHGFGWYGPLKGFRVERLEGASLPATEQEDVG